MPAGLANTLDVAHGEPPRFEYALPVLSVPEGQISYTFLVLPPSNDDSLMFRVNQLSKLPYLRSSNVSAFTLADAIKAAIAKHNDFLIEFLSRLRIK
jgi:hypothetical protein